MADERDPDISRRYRELGAEEPPRALDEAILAASRRAMPEETRSRPAPLVAPTGRRRWYFPLAAAAVIMLAVAITVHMEQQRPDEEIVASTRLPVQKEQQAREAPAAPEPPKAATAPKPQRAPQQFTPEPPPASQPPAAPAARAAEPMHELAKSNEAAAGARSDTADRTRRMEAPAQGPVPAPAPAAKPAPSPAESTAAVAGVASALLYVSPERWLEQIAELRKQGKHEEADKMLAEFRKRYPDYRLSDEMRAKVEKK